MRQLSCKNGENLVASVLWESNHISFKVEREVVQLYNYVIEILYTYNW